MYVILLFGKEINSIKQTVRPLITWGLLHGYLQNAKNVFNQPKEENIKNTSNKMDILKIKDKIGNEVNIKHLKNGDISIWSEGLFIVITKQELLKVLIFLFKQEENKL